MEGLTLPPSFPVNDFERRGRNSYNYGYSFEALLNAPPLDHLMADIAPHLLAEEPRDTVLWNCLFEAFPNWAHGLQPTGDCTCWMQKHLVDVLHCVLWKSGKADKPQWRVFGPSIYGFAKCELVNSYRFHGSGSTGYAVAAASNKFGVLYHKPYSDGTNSADFTSMENNRLSTSWGNAGNGVPNWLEPFAAEHKLVDRIDVKSPEEAGKLIQAGYPVQYCGYAPWGTQRGEDGIATRVSSAAHAMTATGVRWNTDGTVKALWIANTGHGSHCKGPVGPIPVPQVYADCGSWVPRNLVERIYRAGDCKAHSSIEGWPVMELPDSGVFEYL